MKGCNKIFFYTYATGVAALAGTAWLLFQNAAFQLSPSNNRDSRDLSRIRDEPSQTVSPEQFDGSLPVAQEGRRMTATVTAYSPVETCPEGRSEYCLNASEKRPMENRSLACPRALRRGTKILLLQRVYICDDRTALRLNGRFDVFRESHADAISFGKQQLSLFIYD